MLLLVALPLCLLAACTAPGPTRAAATEAPASAVVAPPEPTAVPPSYGTIRAILTFASQEYALLLEYPAGWQPIQGYDLKYGGPDGYFQVSACCGDLSPDDVADANAHHKLHPYGSEPIVEKLTVDGQEARLVLPFADQLAEMAGQAALIVRYPQPVTIRGEEYHYLVLTADQAQIRDLARAVKFLAGFEHANDMNGRPGS